MLVARRVATKTVPAPNTKSDTSYAPAKTSDVLATINRSHKKHPTMMSKLAKWGQLTFI